MVVLEPGTPRLLRAINDRAVLDLLLTHGAAVASGPRRSHRAVQAHDVADPRSTSGGRPRPPERQQLGQAGAECRTVRGQPGGRFRRRPRRHAAADPRRGRRHHRPHGRQLRARDTGTRRPRHDRPRCQSGRRRGGRGRHRPHAARAAHGRDAGRVRSARPAACGMRATCPAGTTRRCCPRSRTRSGSRSRSTTT